MIFLIVNAVLTAVLFLIVVLPPLYIYNPDTYPGESNGPPSAGEVIPDEDITHAVKQKLYLLFIIPTCAAVNAIFLYFAYYRPIRFIHYRVELNLLTLRLTLDAGLQQLQKSGVAMAVNRNTSMSNYSTIGHNANTNNSFIGRNYSKVPGRSCVFDGNEASRQKLALSVNWEWRRHARPKSVRRDAWVNSAVFAEISDLRDEVEQHFLLEGSVADANFAKAVVKTAGAFVPATTSTMLGNQAQIPPPEPAQNGFYNSSRPPLMMIGARSSAPRQAGKTKNIRGGDTINSTTTRDAAPMMERIDAASQCADPVIMVPRETSHHKGSGDYSSAVGGSGNNNGKGRSGGRPSIPRSALQFFKGSSHKEEGSSGNLGSGNQVEQTVASPVRRDAFEPITVDDMSPAEPLNDEAAVQGARAASEGSANRQGLWGRLWHRGENKEA
jgi:hypothetical protein